VMQLPPCLVRGNQMCGVLLAEYTQCFVILLLLDVAVCSQISAGRALLDQVVVRENALGASVVLVREVHLG